MDTSTEIIFVVVGNQIREAQARFNRSRTVAIVDTSSGPVEINKWHRTERSAKIALNKKGRLKP